MWPLSGNTRNMMVVLGEYGGQFGSFNAVFSPKGDDGRPMKLFDVKTGVANPAVIKSMGEIRHIAQLRNNWKTLGPKLKAKSTSSSERLTRFISTSRHAARPRS
jgi:hypothetical protein